MSARNYSFVCLLKCSANPQHDWFDPTLAGEEAFVFTHTFENANCFQVRCFHLFQHGASTKILEKVVFFKSFYSFIKGKFGLLSMVSAWMLFCEDLHACGPKECISMLTASIQGYG